MRVLLFIILSFRNEVRNLMDYAPKARPQCPHKAGKRAPPCSPSLGASDHLSALQKDSPAPRSKTVAPLRHNVRLFGGQAPSSAPFVQPPASSPSGSSARLRCRRPAFGGPAASAMNPFFSSVRSTAGATLHLSLSALGERQGQADGGACPCICFPRTELLAVFMTLVFENG